MNKLLCDRCGKEIKHGMKLDGNELYSNFCSIEVNGYTGEGRAYATEKYDLCSSCYYKLMEFLLS